MKFLNCRFHEGWIVSNRIRSIDKSRISAQTFEFERSSDCYPYPECPSDSDRKIWGKTNLSVLAGYFNFIDFAVLKFRQVMTQHCKRLKARSGIQYTFESISPLLEFLYVFIMSRFARQEVIIILFLFNCLSHNIAERHASTYFNMGGHILAHTNNRPQCVLCHETVVVRSVHSHNIVLEDNSEFCKVHKSCTNLNCILKQHTYNSVHIFIRW